MTAGSCGWLRTFSEGGLPCVIQYVDSVMRSPPVKTSSQIANGSGSVRSTRVRAAVRTSSSAAEPESFDPSERTSA